MSMIFNNTKELANIIDHTILRPDAKKSEIEKICKEGIKYNFHSICINSWWVKFAKSILKKSSVKVCTVIGFPLGMTTNKKTEAIEAIKNGADELDMVIAIGALKSKMYDEVFDDIKQITELNKPVKVILETCLLAEKEIRKACQIAMNANAAFVKTSTGFAKKGADPKIIKIMKEEVKNNTGIKASGGIKDLKRLIEMVNAGATRVGASSSINIINEFNERTNK